MREQCVPGPLELLSFVGPGNEAIESTEAATKKQRELKQAKVPYTCCVAGRRV